jgi:hypothetical protein
MQRSIIIRACQPFNADRNMILCFGCHGWGTLGAVRAVTSRQIVQELVKQAGTKHPFVALLEFELHQQAISSARVREFFVLTRR